MNSNIFKTLAVFVTALLLHGCGSITGIPSHGGGKRFAIEQELVAATARAAAKDLNVQAIIGKRVAIYMVGIGDEGSGNLAGGRYSVDGLFRGGYVNSAETRYPVKRTTTTTGDITTVAGNALNAPKETKGGDVQASIGVRYQGIGGYRTEAFVNPEDSQFLSAVLQESLVLRGVNVVSPQQAEVDVYFTVDVFGTIRSRTDWHISNQERLIAKTALEMTAIDRTSGSVLISPQTTSFEAEYNEQYYFWMGPMKTSKEIRRSDPLLVDFKDMESHHLPVRTTYTIPPDPNSNAPKTTTTTRTVPLTRDLAAPDTSRPDDLQNNAP